MQGVITSGETNGTGGYGRIVFVVDQFNDEDTLFNIINTIAFLAASATIHL